MSEQEILFRKSCTRCSIYFFINLLSYKLKIMNRKDIINKIIEEQSKVLGNLQVSVERYKTASDLDEESTHDPEDFSRQTEAKEMQMRFEELYKNAENDLNFLVKETENPHEIIEGGSIIETEKNFYFVGISVPMAEIKGKQIISFSEDAPVFFALKGKKIGDKITVGDQKQVISAIL